ncbi:MAG: 16S rRNA (guanine(527)-N(7))-methyltransferase RsmG [Oscillospiraceae bacterium]|nr:16S rRNA (guanine(527)-N(7))-methyltransferase RsmG [Oscillospiraceae bacterium]
MKQFEAFTKLLLSENQKYNLTAITDPEEIRQKHFEDSLILLKICELAPGSSLLDVGSGAGFPGIPLAMARPDLRISLLESNGKKAAFLRKAGEALELPVKVIRARAEEIAHMAEYRGQFDWVLSRAVAALPILCELCLPFVAIGGHFAAYKGTGAKAEQELEQAREAIKLLGGAVADVKTRHTDYGERTLVLIKKISQTPANYPRNHGAMLKKSL